MSSEEMRHENNFNEWGSEIRKKEQAYNEERNAAARRRMLSITFDDDDDSIPLGDIIARSKAITPDLPIEEPDNFLSMGDEHLDTIPSVEYLVPIPRESEGLSDNGSECDMPVCDESSPIFTVFSNPLFDSNDNFSSDDESLSEEEIQKDEFNSFSNPLYDLTMKSLQMKDSDSLMEEIDLFLTSDDLMPPGIESDDYDSEGDFCFLKELLINDSPPLPKNESYNLDSFDNPESPVVKSCFDFEPVAAVTNDFDVLNDDETFDPGGGENDVLLNNGENNDFNIFTIRTFLPFVTYPEVFYPPSYYTEIGR
ncbi:hypothetical protein Tco_0877141 [Tanacetum coccineum]|uniref:Uncharacterized protein n=1 Tax=Tanacetum coccineum TaxID=301880 RepID=A0ABQ5BU89_9ASTR